MHYLAALLSVLILTAQSINAYSFEETFGDGWQQRWTHSTDEKYQGKFVVEYLAPDNALKIPHKARHYGLTAKLDSTFDPSEGAILQFEARYSEGQSCSGAYMKFYSHDPSFEAGQMKADTPYTVMFGPDVCGTNSKVHLILNHKNPKTGEISEKHLKSPPRVKADKKTHVYTAVLNPDNTFQVLVDGSVVSEGSLFEKFEPSINPPEDIPDPNDKKPEDWVDEPTIDDPNAVKPEDWVDEAMIDDADAVKPEGWLDDTPSEIPDPDAQKPADWDDEEDGEWVPPTIHNPLCKSAPGCGEWKRPRKANPAYKGPWKPPKIDNPAYKGPWQQATIPNPDYVKDETPLRSMAPIGSVGFELWAMDHAIFFDNILITTDADLATTYREKWNARFDLEKSEEEEKLAKEKKESEEAANKSSPFSFLRDLIQNPALSSIAPYLEPVVDFAEEQTAVTAGFLGLLLFLALMLLRSCFSARKKPDEAAQRKKTDEPEPDDTTVAKDAPTAAGDAGRVEETDEQEEETPTAVPRSRRSN